jgi:hypothetical protein
MKLLYKAALAFAFAFAVTAQSRAETPLAKRQEAMRQLTWAYRMGIRAASKDNPKTWEKILNNYIKRAEKLDPQSEAVKAVKAEFEGYVAGKKADRELVKARSKAYFKMTNAYKSMRRGDSAKAEAYLKEAEAYKCGVAGVGQARSDIKAAKAEAGADKEKDEKDEKDED